MEQSGTDIHVFDTGDSGIIEKIVAAIENGKAVSDEKQEEAANAMLKGNGRYKNYRLEFSSESYPKLLLDYNIVKVKMEDSILAIMEI